MNQPFLHHETPAGKKLSWWAKAKAAIRKPAFDLDKVMDKVDREELTVGCQDCQRTFAALEKVRSHSKLNAKKNVNAAAKMAAEERCDSGVALEDNDESVADQTSEQMAYENQMIIK